MGRKLEELTQAILGAAIDVHRELGPGLLERVYAVCLADELALRGHVAVQQVDVPVIYKGRRLPIGYRIDLLVDDAVILEIKSVDRLLQVHAAQLLTYLRLSGHEVGLLLNFNVPVLKDGIRRCYRPERPSRDGAPV